MSELFKFPLRVEDTAQDDINIVDAGGNVVMKCNWMSDLNHVRLQKERGEAFVKVMNREASASMVNGDNFCVPGKPVEAAVENGEIAGARPEGLNYTDSVKLKKTLHRITVAKNALRRLEAKFKVKYADEKETTTT